MIAFYLQFPDNIIWRIDHTAGWNELNKSDTYFPEHFSKDRFFEIYYF